MDQESVIAEIERRAFEARISIAQLCRDAGINPTTFSRWKPSERNPEPTGPTLRTITKLQSALAKAERQQRRRQRQAA